MLGYTGTLAFLTDKTKVQNPPKSWADLKSGSYKIAIGDVMKANQAQFAVLAAAYAHGETRKIFSPALTFC